MSNTAILLTMVTMILVIAGTDEHNALRKNNAPTNSYTDYLANIDDYPVLVSKRTALLLDQLMIALQNALNNQSRKEKGNRMSTKSTTLSYLPTENLPVLPLPQAQTMDLQRQKQGQRFYWRCFFNIVTCYKKK